MSTDRYVSPLSERYASKEMQYIFIIFDVICDRAYDYG